MGPWQIISKTRIRQSTHRSKTIAEFANFWSRTRGGRKSSWLHVPISESDMPPTAESKHYNSNQSGKWYQIIKRQVTSPQVQTSDLRLVIARQTFYFVPRHFSRFQVKALLQPTAESPKLESLWWKMHTNIHALIPELPWAWLYFITLCGQWNEHKWTRRWELFWEADSHADNKKFTAYLRNLKT